MGKLVEKALSWYLDHFLSKEFSVLSGAPETGKWYTVPISGAVCSDGTPWRGTFRKGSENNLVIYFFGGGVSINAYTAARPQGAPNGYYNPGITQGLRIMENCMVKWGIGNQITKNPFRNWSFIVIPYCNGDFHAGEREQNYTALDGSEKTIFYHGHKNFRSMLEKCMGYLDPDPEKIVIAGGSAGGFGTAINSSYVAERFPSCKNITVCVDSSLLIYDKWHDTAAKEWQSNETISGFTQSDNITLDALRYTQGTYGNRVKLLFDCSIRDYALVQTQVFFDEGIDPPEHPTAAQADRFQLLLKQMAEDMRRELPGSGVFIWDDVTDKSIHLTRHTGIGLNTFFQKHPEGKSLCDWLWDAVNGKVASYGLDLLDRRFSA